MDVDVVRLTYLRSLLNSFSEVGTTNFAEQRAETILTADFRPTPDEPIRSVEPASRVKDLLKLAVKLSSSGMNKTSKICPSRSGD